MSTGASSSKKKKKKGAVTASKDKAAFVPGGGRRHQAPRPSPSTSNIVFSSPPGSPLRDTYDSTSATFPTTTLSQGVVLTGKGTPGKVYTPQQLRLLYAPSESGRAFVAGGGRRHLVRKAVPPSPSSPTSPSNTNKQPEHVNTGHHHLRSPFKFHPPSFSTSRNRAGASDRSQNQIGGLGRLGRSKSTTDLSATSSFESPGFLQRRVPDASSSVIVRLSPSSSTDNYHLLLRAPGVLNACSLSILSMDTRRISRHKTSPTPLLSLTNTGKNILTTTETTITERPCLARLSRLVQTFYHHLPHPRKKQVPIFCACASTRIVNVVF